MPEREAPMTIKFGKKFGKRLSLPLIIDPWPLDEPLTSAKCLGYNRPNLNQRELEGPSAKRGATLRTELSSEPQTLERFLTSLTALTSSLALCSTAAKPPFASSNGDSLPSRYLINQRKMQI